jgi:hypothetical protein
MKSTLQGVSKPLYYIEDHLMRTITNDYHDAQILDLGAGYEKGPYFEKGPYLVTQTGVSPNDPVPKTHMFVLRPDGKWVDFNAYACQGKPEAMDELVFHSVPEVMTAFGKLVGRPKVVDLPVDKEGLQAWLDRHAAQDPLEAARAWAVEYRKRQRDRRR